MRIHNFAIPARFLLPAFVLCLLAPELGRAQHRGDGLLRAEGLTTYSVTVEADGESRSVQAPEGTVAGALKAAGVILGERDECSPAPADPVAAGMQIVVHRITVSTVTQTEPIRAKTRILPTSRLRRGITLIERHPEDGLKELKYEVTLRDGKVAARRLLSARVVKPAQDKVILVGGRDARLPSRGGYFTGRRELLMVASGYDPSPRSCGPGATGRTYLGMKARRGIVAVDPRVIPLRARVYVEGYGEAIAGDIGGAIKGNRIDLCFETYREADRYGLKRVRVWILSE